MAVLRSCVVLTLNRVWKLLDIAGKSVSRYVEKLIFLPNFFVFSVIFGYFWDCPRIPVFLPLLWWQDSRGAVLLTETVFISATPIKKVNNFHATHFSVYLLSSVTYGCCKTLQHCFDGRLWLTRLAYFNSSSFQLISSPFGRNAAR